MSDPGYVPTHNLGDWVQRLPHHVRDMSLPLAVWDHIAALDSAHQSSLRRERALYAERSAAGASTATKDESESGCRDA